MDSEKIKRYVYKNQPPILARNLSEVEEELLRRGHKRTAQLLFITKMNIRTLEA